MWGLFPFFETPVPSHFLFIWREEISKSTSMELRGGWRAESLLAPYEDLSGEGQQEAQQILPGSNLWPQSLMGLWWCSLASSCPRSWWCHPSQRKVNGDVTPVYRLILFTAIHIHSSYYIHTILLFALHAGFQLHVVDLKAKLNVQQQIVNIIVPFFPLHCVWCAIAAMDVPFCKNEIEFLTYAEQLPLFFKCVFP